MSGNQTSRSSRGSSEDTRADSFKSNTKMHLNFILEAILLVLYSIYMYLKTTFGFFVEPQPKSLIDEVVLITGGANGIGKELCWKLIQFERNFKLVVWDIDVMSLDECTRDLKKSGFKNVFGYKVDISDRKAIEKAASKVREEVGQVTILINNAGIAGPMGKSWSVAPDEVEKVVKVNLLSHVWMLREFLPHMLKNNHGHVVEVCSVVAFASLKQSSSYIATKQGLKGYIESVKEDIRYEYKNSQVLISLAFPSFTETAMTAGAGLKAGKYPFLLQTSTPEYVATKILDGLLKNKEYIYAPPSSWVASWAIPLIPMDIFRKCIDIFDITTPGNE